MIDYENVLYGSTTVAMVYKESLSQEIPDVYEPEYKAMEIFYQKHRHLKLRWKPTIIFSNIQFIFTYFS